MALGCVILHNICIDRRDFIPRVFDLSYDSTANKHRDGKTILELLDLTFELGRSGALNVRKAIAEYFWDEKNISRNNQYT